MAASAMTGARYRLAIKRLGMNQREAAEFMGVSPRQGRYWAAGEREVPQSVNLLLRLMLAYGIKPADVLAFKDGDLPSRR